MSIKLRTCLILTFSVLVILLSAILSLIISQKSSQKIEEEIGQSLAGMAYQMSDKLDNFMWSRSVEVDILGSMDAFRDEGSLSNVQKLIDQLKASVPSFSWIGFVSPQGKVMASTDGILMGSDISSRPVYMEGMKGKFIGDVHDAVLLSKLLPNPTGEPLQFVDISIPVKGAEGSIQGVLAAHLSWEWSKEVEKSLLAPMKSSDKNIELFIVSKTDHTVLLGPKEMVGYPLSLASINQAKAGENGWELAVWPDGKTYLTGYAYGDGYLNYPGLGWTVIVRQPQSIAYSSVRELQKFIMLAGIIACVLFALIGWYLAEKISRPIRGITAAADRLRAGELVEIPEYRGFTDIQILSRSLKELVDSLVRTESELGTMQTLAHYDQLTGLPNRIALDRYLEKALEQVDVHEEALTFLYLDLDGFKGVNDTFGHLVGDILLQKVAQRLLEIIKVGNMAARLGGDEFLIILRSSNARTLTEAEETAGKIIELLNKPFIIEYQKIQIGCSIGGAVYPKDSKSTLEVLRKADEALYQSKQAGKNQVTFYPPLTAEYIS